MDLKQIEQKWQRAWKDAGIFEVDPDPERKKYYVNFPYPYMNGYLHIGHAFSLMRLEILARYKRMTGHNVLWPFAFHCTGTPIVAAANRIKKGEESQIKILRDMGIQDEDIPKFADELEWTRHFPKEAKKDLERLGIAVDWRRTFITTSLNPHYSKFIEWQFNRLKEENLIKTGEYPVVWCTNDNSPTGDHARLKGEGERPQEFTLLKFSIPLEQWKDKYGENIFLLAATLRPETVFGQTNLWVDPDGSYSLSEYEPELGEKGNENGEVEKERTKELWILSGPAAEKLKEQKKDLNEIATITGRELIGQFAKAPVIHRMIPILPSYFCDPEKGTGIVTSVPSDAPDDWMGIYDLQNNEEECRKFGLDLEMVKAIEPIPIIESAELGTNSAVKLCQQMGIKNQHDREKLVQAKHEIYKHGFYSGKMTEECGEFAGQPVEKVKEEVKEMLLQNGEADIMYELAAEVICRCLTKCIVKIVDNQWFLSYSDPVWKERTHKALDRMNLYPEAVRKQFDYVIDWLNDWACTREFGLGTPLPWDKKWLIESLSDSTIYMAYYTISKYLENGLVGDADNLDHDFFEYVFRGIGDAKSIAANVGITTELLNDIRNEFLYWYPYDVRGSGKDLIQNHLTFSIFNHVAVFGDEFAPLGFTVNGWIKVGGDKMSKSAGNFFTLRQVIDTYGSDIVRFTLGQAGEGLEDPNWEIEFAEATGKRLHAWADFAMENYRSAEECEAQDRPLTEVDKWFRSKLNRLILETREHMELTNFRSGIKTGYFDLQNVFRKYQKRTMGDPHPALLNQFIEAQTKILTPYVPHFTEEVWSSLPISQENPCGAGDGDGGEDGSPSFIANAPYPDFNEEYIDEGMERQEDFLGNTVDDIRNILKVTKIEPKKIVLYTSRPWKYAVLSKVMEIGKFDVGILMKQIMADPDLRKHGKEVNKFILQIVKERPTFMPEFDEFALLQENISFIATEFDCEAEVYQAEDPERYDPQRKAGVAKPYKPGIFIE